MVDFTPYDPANTPFTSAGVSEAFFASTPVPEPATLSLLGMSFAGLAVARRRRSAQPRG